MPHSLVRFLRKALPHIVALSLFAGVSALFFVPQYNGRALRQTDMVMFNGATSDIRQHIDRYDEHPQWAGRNFSGMPSYLIDMNYDGRWVKQAADRLYFLGQPAGWLFVAMAGFYLMLLLFGIDPWLAIAGGLGYGLSSYFVIIIGAGHITKMMALAWVAPMVGSVWYAYRRHRWLGASLAGLFAAVEISTSHPQITYYFLFVLLALVINEFVAAYKAGALARFGKTTAVLALAAALAVGANIVQLYYIAQHTPETTRGRSELTESHPTDAANQTGGLNRNYITAWSYGKLETLNLLVPNLYGGGRDFAPDGEVAQVLKKYDAPRGFERNLPSYWGPQPSTEGPVYLGASLVFLAVFGMFVLRGREKWWIAAVSVLAIFLAWGRHMMWFTDLFLDYFPMYNKFRTVSMILVIVEWAVPLLAILGLVRLWNRDETDNARIRKGLQWSLSITGGLCLLIGLFGPMLSSFAGPGDEAIGLPEPILAAMRDERTSLMRADAFRSLLFVALTAGLVWLLARGKVKRNWFLAGLCGIILLDLFPVDKRYVSAADFQPERQALAIPMTEADRLILQDTTDYRVANFTLDPFTDATTSYHHRSVGGYHAAKLRRYQDLIEHHLSRQNMAVYDMLNTKYFIVPDQEGRATVQQNPYACGSAWFVDSIRWVDNPDAEIDALTGFDPHTTAVVDRRFAPQLEGISFAADSTATIALTDYRVNRQIYRTRSAQEGLAVLSEIYYPKGWTAIIDGERAPYLRADYVLRAIRIPAGEHTVEFRFAAPNFDLLVEVTRASSAILLFGTLGLLVGTLLRKRKPQPTAPDTDGTPS
ncbi:hypothetical protein [uncultured Rikenella sp.]|uniref:hypothetical protein n=1 Tax=uncultured Rikenella sp. TaxID=368003 RepID=UPI0025E7CB7A|nr:hypothetical protein [uncultured Rikenella sp.]